MKRTELSFLFQVEAPWIYVGLGEAERKKWNPVQFYSQPGLNACARRLRGEKMRTTGALMNEFGAAFQFFEGFGENWYALEECLNYLDEWLPADAYIVVIESAEETLTEEPDHLVALLKTLDAVGEYWSKAIAGNGRFDRSPVPFHVLLNLSNEKLATRERLIAAAREACVSLRF